MRQDERTAAVNGFQYSCPASSRNLTEVPLAEFKYMEEEQTEKFFIPCVWSLVYNSAVALYWNPSDIQLFPLDSS
ncbi:dymeclin-like isoform X3 [Zonotrichia albicollis]|uniref:dymeclin-like isoform X3 n=1 Tax=Zonotrichia albicollis TaxID=44394 RepID=UPI003D80E4DB